MHSFKTKYMYLAALARGETVNKIPSKKTGRPLTLGEIDGDVQNYIKSLRATGTPPCISVPIVLAAAEGIVRTRNPTLLTEHGGTVHSQMIDSKLLKLTPEFQTRKAFSHTKHDSIMVSEASFMMDVAAFCLE